MHRVNMTDSVMKAFHSEVGMGHCEQCSAELPPTRERFCSNQCGWTFHNARRGEVAKVTDVETRPIDRQAMELVVSGHLPPPFQVDAHDGRALWDFCGLAVLLDQRPDALVELLLANGPVHLHADRGIPSSWQSLIERYGPT